MGFSEDFVILERQVRTAGLNLRWDPTIKCIGLSLSHYFAIKTKIRLSSFSFVSSFSDLNYHVGFFCVCISQLVCHMGEIEQPWVSIIYMQICGVLLFVIITFCLPIKVICRSFGDKQNDQILAKIIEKMHKTLTE